MNLRFISIHVLIVGATLLVSAPAARAQTAGATDPKNDPVVVARNWWRAFADGDTAYIQARTARDLALTLSAGHVFDRPAALARVATHIGGRPVGMEWLSETVQLVGPSAAIVNSRQNETIGPNSRIFRFMTVLQRVDGIWQVAAAQSTREMAPPTRISSAEAGPLGEYAGSYRARAAILRISVQDSVLVLTDPAGVQMRMVPVGPGIFESEKLLLVGTLRFAFTRNATGKVVALSRLSDGVTTYSRIQAE